MSIDAEIKKLSEFLDSPEGKEKTKRYVQEMIDSRERLSSHLKSFHDKYQDNLDAVLERLMDKYYSDEYVNKEHRLGYEPREKLLWFVFEYANVYCKPCTDEKYFNDFTAGAFYVGSYVMQVMCGQGSVLRIDKIK